MVTLVEVDMGFASLEGGWKCPHFVFVLTKVIVYMPQARRGDKSIARTLEVSVSSGAAFQGFVVMVASTSQP